VGVWGGFAAPDPPIVKLIAAKRNLV